MRRTFCRGGVFIIFARRKTDERWGRRWKVATGVVKSGTILLNPFLGIVASIRFFIATDNPATIHCFALTFKSLFILLLVPETAFLWEKLRLQLRRGKREVRFLNGDVLFLLLIEARARGRRVDHLRDAAI